MSEELGHFDENLSLPIPLGEYGVIIFGHALRGRQAADYERGARLILEYYRKDPASAVAYLARFLSSVYDELNAHGCYMESRRDHSPTFSGYRPSVAALAFARFQELLFHDSKLIREVLAHPACSQRVRTDSWLANRQHSNVALTRGIDWRPSEQFANPEPIPRIVVQSFMQQRRQVEEAYRHSRDLERRQSKLEDLEHRLQIAVMIAKRRDESAFRKHVLQEALILPVLERILRFLSEPVAPIMAWQIAASDITSDVLSKLNTEELSTLRDHVLPIRKQVWKQLCCRINDILSGASLGNDV